MKLGHKWSEEYKPPKPSDVWYPTIDLRGDQAEKAGLDRAKVGDEVVFTAKGVVSSISQSKDGTNCVCIEVHEAEFKERDPGSVMFPNEGKS